MIENNCAMMQRGCLQLPTKSDARRDGIWCSGAQGLFQLDKFPEKTASGFHAGIHMRIFVHCASRCVLGLLATCGVIVLPFPLSRIHMSPYVEGRSPRPKSPRPSQPRRRLYRGRLCGRSRRVSQTLGGGLRQRLGQELYPDLLAVRVRRITSLIWADEERRQPRASLLRDANEALEAIARPSADRLDQVVRNIARGLRCCTTNHYRMTDIFGHSARSSLIAAVYSQKHTARVLSRHQSPRQPPAAGAWDRESRSPRTISECDVTSLVIAVGLGRRQVQRDAADDRAERFDRHFWQKRDGDENLL